MTDQTQLPGLGDNLPPDDIELLKTQLRERTGEHLDRIDQLADAARSYPEEIESAETAERATLLIAQMKTLAKDLDALKGSLKAPHQERINIIESHFRAVLYTLGPADERITAALNAYMEAEEKRRAANREALARKAAERAAKAKNVEDVEEVERLAAKAKEESHPMRVRSGYGQTAHRRESMVWEIEDFDKVPRGYLTVDSGKVRKAMNAGVPIPGIKYTKSRLTAVKR